MVQMFAVIVAIMVCCVALINFCTMDSEWGSSDL